jgi:hypothetical protein
MLQWVQCVLPSISLSSRQDHLSNRYILLLMTPCPPGTVVQNQSWLTAS